VSKDTGHPRRRRVRKLYLATPKQATRCSTYRMRPRVLYRLHFILLSLPFAGSGDATEVDCCPRYLRHEMRGFCSCVRSKQYCHVLYMASPQPMDNAHICASVCPGIAANRCCYQARDRQSASLAFCIRLGNAYPFPTPKGCSRANASFAGYGYLPDGDAVTRIVALTFLPWPLVICPVDVLSRIRKVCSLGPLSPSAPA
jgi:hypothetical protein